MFLFFHCAQVKALIIQWILTGFRVSSVTKKQYHFKSYKQLNEKKKTSSLCFKKKRHIARLQVLRPKKIETEEPSVTDEIDMVFNESIPMKLK